MKKILLVLAALAALVCCKNNVKDADSEYAVDMIKKGETIPAFSLKDRSDVLRTQADFAGKYAVYDFWASWCPDCRAEVPALKAMQAAAPDVAFVSISFDRSFDAFKQYVQDNALGGVQLFDPAGKKESAVAAAFHVKWIPSLYLVGADGRVLLATVVAEKIARAL